MAEFIPLKAERVNFDFFVAYNAEESLLRYGFEIIVKGKLAELFLSEDFESQAVSLALCDEIRLKQKEALKQTIVHEREQMKNYKKRDAIGVHLTHLPEVGEQDHEMGIDAEVERINIPPAFIDAIALKVQETAQVFTELEKVRQYPGFGPALHALLQQAHVLSASLKQDGIDKAFSFIQTEAVTPSVVVPHDQATVLHFFTYLPRTLRFIVQDYLINTCHMDHLTSLEAESSDDERAFLQLIKRYKQIGIMLNSHWDRFVQYYGASEEIIGCMAKARLEETELLVIIANEVKEKPQLGKILEKNLSFLRSMLTGIEKLDKESGCVFYQCTDVGHCFAGFDRDLYDSINPNQRQKLEQAKNGKSAVILEDDPSQMKDWQDSVGKYSQYSLLPDGKSVCATPDQVPSALEDAQIGYYLLDIENGTDKTAGIETAKRLLDEIVEKHRMKLKKKEKPDDQVKIVVWSRSKELTVNAEKLLKEHIDQRGYKNVVSGFSSFNSSNPVEIRVMLKSERPF